MKIKHTVGDVFSNREGVIVNLCNKEGKIRSVTSLRIKNKWPIVYDQYVEYLCDSRPSIGVYGASSLSTMIYAAKEAQWDGTLNICTPWIDNDS